MREIDKKIKALELELKRTPSSKTEYQKQKAILENIKFKIHTQNISPKKKRKGKSKKKRDSGKKMMKSLSKILKKSNTKKSFNPTKKINSAYYATGGWRWSATKSKSNSAKTRTEKKSKKKSKKSSKNTRSNKTKQ